MADTGSTDQGRTAKTGPDQAKPAPPEPLAWPEDESDAWPGDDTDSPAEPPTPTPIRDETHVPDEEPHVTPKGEPEWPSEEPGATVELAVPAVGDDQASAGDQEETRWPSPSEEDVAHLDDSEPADHAEPADVPAEAPEPLEEAQQVEPADEPPSDQWPADDAAEDSTVEAEDVPVEEPTAEAQPDPADALDVSVDDAQPLAPTQSLKEQEPAEPLTEDPAADLDEPTSDARTTELPTTAWQPDHKPADHVDEAAEDDSPVEQPAAAEREPDDTPVGPVEESKAEPTPADPPTTSDRKPDHEPEGSAEEPDRDEIPTEPPAPFEWERDGEPAGQVEEPEEDEAPAEAPAAFEWERDREPVGRVEEPERDGPPAEALTAFGWESGGESVGRVEEPEEDEIPAAAFGREPDREPGGRVEADDTPAELPAAFEWESGSGSVGHVDERDDIPAEVPTGFEWKPGGEPVLRDDEPQADATPAELPAAYEWELSGPAGHADEPDDTPAELPLALEWEPGGEPVDHLDQPAGAGAPAEVDQEARKPAADDTHPGFPAVRPDQGETPHPTSRLPRRPAPAGPRTDGERRPTIQARPYGSPHGAETTRIVRPVRPPVRQPSAAEQTSLVRPVEAAAAEQTSLVRPVGPKPVEQVRPVGPKPAEQTSIVRPEVKAAEQTMVVRQAGAAEQTSLVRPVPAQRAEGGPGGPPDDGPPAVADSAGGRKRKTGLIVGIAVAAVVALAAGVVFAVPGMAERLGLVGEEQVAIAPPPAPVEFVPALNAPGDDGPPPTSDGVAQALAGPGSAGALGTLTGVVIDPATGETLFSKGADTARVPASTLKILSSAAALLTLPHTEQLVTRVVQGDKPGTVVIVGGGDPSLSSLPVGKESVYPGAAHLDDLVAQVKAKGPVDTVLVDLDRYAGDNFAPGWERVDIAAGHITPIVPAMLDGGRSDPTEATTPRAANPARKLAEEFAARIGAQVPANAATSAKPEAKVLGEVKSAPVVELVDNVLQRSDNVLAETLIREVAIATGQEPSFEGATKAVINTLRDNGFPVDNVELRDGSGLSTLNKATVGVIAEILRVAAAPDGADPRTAKLRPLLAGLPVAGGSGTLAGRYQEGAAAEGRGWVRAKTGTLPSMRANSLAGVVLDRDGRLLVFALMADGPDTLEARKALDGVAAALRKCGCS